MEYLLCGLRLIWVDYYWLPLVVFIPAIVLYTWFNFGCNILVTRCIKILFWYCKICNKFLDIMGLFDVNATFLFVTLAESYFDASSQVLNIFHLMYMVVAQLAESLIKSRRHRCNSCPSGWLKKGWQTTIQF